MYRLGPAFRYDASVRSTNAFRPIDAIRPPTVEEHVDSASSIRVLNQQFVIQKDKTDAGVDIDTCVRSIPSSGFSSE